MNVKTIVTASLLTLASPSFAFAHSAIFDCYDNGNNTVTCQGGYSNGSSAEGAKIIVSDEMGKTLETAPLDSNNKATVKKPTITYFINFESGDGHGMRISGKNIVE